MADAPAPPAVDPALTDFARQLGRASARAAAGAGLDLDVDDPRVARWLLLTTLDAMFLSPGARSSAEALRRAAKASADESIAGHRRRGQRPQLTWDKIVALTSERPPR